MEADFTAYTCYSNSVIFFMRMFACNLQTQRKEKNMKKMKINPKVTHLGRILARLFGEEHGAVMMEYVVLAVLLVAAVVAIVIAFGGRIAKQFKAAGDSVGGKVETASQTVRDANDEFDKNARAAQDLQNQINGGEFQQ